MFAYAGSSLLRELFSSCGKRGLLIAVVSLVVGHRLEGTQASAVTARGLSSCGSKAL